MFIRDLSKCKEFVAGDNTILRELFNPLKDKIKDEKTGEEKPLDLRYSLAHAIVKPGEITYNHKLKTSEVYYILKGKGLMFIDGEQEEVNVGMAVYIPPNALQKIKNTGEDDLVFLCIVDPAWKPEDEEVVD